MTTKNEEVTGKAKSAAALAKVNAERAAKKKAAAAPKTNDDGDPIVPQDDDHMYGDSDSDKNGQDAPKVVKSFADLDLLRDRLF